MSHCIYRVQSFETVAPFTLCITFDDGSTQTINFKSILVGKLYSRLSDLSLFNQVRIDPEVHTMVWPNGADFDAATLHDWAQHKEELIKRARKDGEVQIRRRDGQTFALKPIKTKKSPLDVPGVNLKLSSKDIVDIVREMRERN